MNKMIRNLILLAMVCLLLVPMLTGCGKNMDESISIEVESVKEAKGGAQIVLATKNNTGHNISLGWVNSCHIEVTTDENTYYYEPFMTEIPRGKDTLNIFVQNYEGALEKLVITELCLLNSNGLPGKEMHDVVVYDNGKGIDGFEDAFSKMPTFHEAIFIIVPVLMVAIIVTVIVVAIFTHKKNMAAAQQFNPFGAEQGFTPNAAQQGADLHQMHVDAHQQFVQQEHIRQHTEFAHQSVTPIDQGGFAPPPPPPPMPPMGM